jgi:Asp/Glu/hydantoin racemase
MNSEVTIGVLNLDAVPGRVKQEEDTPGNLRNDKTFNFRLKRETVRGATPDRFAADILGKKELTPHFIEAAKKLEARGVDAIVGDCGFIAMYQKDIAREVSVPVATSSLILVPLVFRMLAENQKVGILTQNDKHLVERHFNAAGWSSKDIPVVLKEFGEAKWNLVPTSEMVRLAKELVEENSDVGAIVLECSVIPPHARAIQKATGLPVFDITTLVKLVHAAVDPPDYSQT